MKKELKIAMPSKASKTKKGYGFFISATNGERQAIMWAKKLTTPYAVATRVVGNNLFTAMIAVLKITD